MYSYLWSMEECNFIFVIFSPYGVKTVSYFWQNKKPRVDMVEEERDEAPWSVIWSSVGLFFLEGSNPSLFYIIELFVVVHGFLLILFQFWVKENCWWLSRQCVGRSSCCLIPTTWYLLVNKCSFFVVNMYRYPSKCTYALISHLRLDRRRTTAAAWCRQAWTCVVSIIA